MLMQNLKRQEGGQDSQRSDGRMPHRSKAQIQAMKELSRTTAASKESVQGERITLAQELCLLDTNIGGESGLTQDEKVLILKSHEWQRFLQSRITTRENVRKVMMQRQVDESRKAMDRQSRRDFLDEHKGPSKYTGKRTAGLAPEQLQWEALIRAQWIHRSNVKNDVVWDERVATN